MHDYKNDAALVDTIHVSGRRCYVAAWSTASQGDLSASCMSVMTPVISKRRPRTS